MQHLRLPLLIVYASCGSCLIRLQNSVIAEYLWIESIAIIYFLHGVSHQGKVAYEATTFGLIWPVVSHSARFQYSMIMNITRRNQLLTYSFCMEVFIKEKQHLRLSLLFGFAQIYLSSNEIAGFFDQQCIWKESIDILDFFIWK